MPALNGVSIENRRTRRLEGTGRDRHARRKGRHTGIARGWPLRRRHRAVGRFALRAGSGRIQWRPFFRRSLRRETRGGFNPGRAQGQQQVAVLFIGCIFGRSVRSLVLN